MLPAATADTAVVVDLERTAGAVVAAAVMNTANRTVKRMLDIIAVVAAKHGSFVVSERLG